MNSVVSIIIVNFNAGHFLTTCVTSVLASTIPVVVYVIDNASIDNSVETLQQTIGDNQRVHLIRNPANFGFARAVNQALASVTTDYLLILNPDCVLQTDTIERFCAAMNAHPHAGMAGGLIRNPDGSEQAGCQRRIPSPWRSLVRVLHLDKLFPQHPYFENFILTGHSLPSHPIEIEGISGACMFVRRKALETVGYLDEGYFLHCEDLDWFMRFHHHQWAILFIANIEIIHVKGACSHHQPVRVLWHKHRGMVRFYRKFFRHQYPIILLWLVISAVWMRFVALTVVTLVMGNKN